MWKKEFKYAIKKAILLGMLPLVVPIMALLAPGILNDKKVLYDIFVFSWWLVLIFTALVLPGTSFQQERKENAWEYLLSTPVKKGKILLYKLVPRLLILLVIILLAIIFFHYTSSFSPNFLYRPLGLVILPILFFIISLSLSLFEMKDTMALFAFLVYLFSTVLAGFIKKSFHIKTAGISFNSFVVAWFISLGILATICLIGFREVFSRFDLKPEAVHRKKFLLISGLPIVAITIIAIIFR